MGLEKITFVVHVAKFDEMSHQQLEDVKMISANT